MAAEEISIRFRNRNPRFPRLPLAFFIDADQDKFVIVVSMESMMFFADCRNFMLCGTTAE